MPLEQHSRSKNGLTDSLVIKAAGCLLIVATIGVVVALVLHGSYPSIAGFVTSVVTGLCTSAGVLFFYERERDTKERKRELLMVELFVKRCAPIVERISHLYCEMYWAASRDKPQQSSKVASLISTDFFESIKYLDVRAPGPDASNSVYASVWITHLEGNLSRELGSLDRLYSRYLVYLPDEISLKVEAVISTALPGYLSDFERVILSGDGIDPMAGFVTKLALNFSFPLAAVCANHAHEVAELASYLGQAHPGSVNDDTWWSANPPKQNGYAVISTASSQRS